MKFIMKENSTWLVTRGDNDTQSFACNGSHWSSFDDMNAVKIRVLYFPFSHLSLFLFIQVGLVNKFGLGGVHLFAIFDDDFRNELGCGETPFSRTINELIRGFGDCVLPSCP